MVTSLHSSFSWINTKHPITRRGPEARRRVSTTVQLPGERIGPHVAMNDEVSSAVWSEPHQPPHQRRDEIVPAHVQRRIRADGVEADVGGNRVRPGDSHVGQAETRCVQPAEGKSQVVFVGGPDGEAW